MEASKYVSCTSLALVFVDHKKGDHERLQRFYEGLSKVCHQVFEGMLKIGMENHNKRPT